MFEQTLIETAIETRGRRRRTVLLSYVVEALAVLAALSFPLLHTEALPLENPPRLPPPTHYVRPHVEVVATPAELRNVTRPAPINVFQSPSRIPPTIDRTPEPSAPAVPGVSSENFLDGAIPVTDPREQNAVLEGMLHNPAIAPAHPTLVPRPSKAQESLLIRQIKPVYPQIARLARIEGTVEIQAVIARDGTIQHLEVLRGHPMLVQAAVEAVKQWRYRPFLLDGDPVEVETEITVHFNLSSR